MSQGKGGSSFEHLIQLMKDGDLLLPRGPSSYFTFSQMLARSLGKFAKGDVDFRIDSYSALSWCSCVEGDSSRFATILESILTELPGDGLLRVLLKYED